MNGNHGLIIKPIEPEHFVFGDQKLGDTPVNPGGQWDSWLPIPEDQAPFGFEPFACTTFALLNAVEIMIRQKYGQSENLCKKFLAYASGTTQNGNDPHTVAETLRTKGDCLESDYPYTSSDNSWAQFYKTPTQWLYTKALQFCAQYAFGHSWVSPATPGNMMSALDYSPLTAGVDAWNLDPATGYYVRMGVSEHDVCIYGYGQGQYWKAFDSYSQETKKLAWDFGFDAVKRYTLNSQVVNPSAWQKFLQWFQAVIDKLRYGSFGGVARSPQWSSVRDAFLKQNPTCAVCGGTKKLQAHHIRVFHLNPSDELNPQNLIPLCEVSSRNCHLNIGHLGSFQSWNENVVEDARIWHDKRANRP